MIIHKESKGEAIRLATEAVLDTAVQFREVETDPAHGTHTRAIVWAEFMRSLMNYHLAECAIFADDQPASGVDCEHGPADSCRCLGNTPPPTGKGTPPTPRSATHGLGR